MVVIVLVVMVMMMMTMLVMMMVFVIAGRIAHAFRSAAVPSAETSG